MKKIVVLLCILLPAIFSSARQDEKAKNILDQVSQKTKSFKSVYADFSFSMQNKEMDINERNDGSIKLKGQKYCVDLPGIGVKVYSDGKTVWNYMKDGNQVTISDVDDQSSGLMDDPSAIFSIYEKGFRSQFVSEKKEGTKTVYRIDLFPESGDYEVSRITVLIDKATMLIHSAVLFGTDGNQYSIDIKKIDTIHDYPDADFVFNASQYPDVEVIDFR